MRQSAPRVCSEPGGQKPELSLSLALIDQIQTFIIWNAHFRDARDGIWSSAQICSTDEPELQWPFIWHGRKLYNVVLLVTVFVLSWGNVLPVKLYMKTPFTYFTNNIIHLPCLVIFTLWSWVHRSSNWIKRHDIKHNKGSRQNMIFWRLPLSRLITDGTGLVHNSKRKNVAREVFVNTAVGSGTDVALAFAPTKNIAQQFHFSHAIPTISSNPRTKPLYFLAMSFIKIWYTVAPFTNIV